LPKTFESYHVPACLADLAAGARSAKVEAAEGRRRRTWNPEPTAWYDPDMAWDPLRDLRAWQDRLERLSTPRTEAWTPPVDVYETADKYIVAAELPGLTRDQIELALGDTRLTVRGQRGPTAAGADEVPHYHQVERGHGSFARTFEFADKIDVDAVAADLSNGVLTVTLPKVPPAPIRKIEVR
jgi:HSP20 family protein